MLDNHDANVVGLVPCLVEETIREMFQTTIDLATEEEIKKAKDYVLKKPLRHYCSLEQTGPIMEPSKIICNKILPRAQIITQNQWMRP